MTIFQAVILGVVQGISEFLPISSSGHLILIPRLFAWGQQGIDFDVAIHLATLCSIVWVLRKDVVNAFHGSLGWKIAAGTVPVVIVGFLLSGTFMDSIRNTTVVACMLIVWGIILYFADRYAAKYTRNGVIQGPERVSWQQAIFIGVMQVFALIPGTSRSGSTISAGLFAGLDRETAARFSFLLAIPAILGAGLLIAIDVAQSGFETAPLPLLFGFVSAFISGSLAIQFLLHIVKRISYAWFAGYRILLGILLLILTVF